MKIKTCLLLITCSLGLIAFNGCESFRKKFVRKSKEKKEVRVVVNTHEYESLYSVAVNYEVCYNFWLASQKELIDSLDGLSGNRKRRVFATRRIIDNLERMSQYLVPEKQAQLNQYISEYRDLPEQVDQIRMKQVQVLNN